MATHSRIIAWKIPWIVIHNAKPLYETMIKVANDLAIPLVSSPLAKYDACVKLHEAFLAEERG